MPLGKTVNCQSNIEVFNHEVEQQWRNNQNDLSLEEFALHWNSLCNLQNPVKAKTLGNDQDLTEVEDFDEDEVGTEGDLDRLPLINDQQLHHLKKRKQVCLCRHKLQGRAYYQFRNQKPATEQPRRLPEREEAESDHEWLQLIQMERMIERQKQELLKHGARDLDDEDDAWDELQEAEEDPVKEEDDSLDDGDLTYITAILNSFSRPKLNSEQPSASSYTTFTPEGAQAQALAQTMTPPKFNQKFNQKLTIYDTGARNFSCFSNFEEEGTTELADYFSDKEDDSLDYEDPTGESDTWSQSNFDKLEEISDEEDDNSDEEDAWSEHRATRFGLESIKETGEKNNCKSISSISNEAELAFSAWQPYIPPEPVFRNSFAQSWRSAFSQPASLSQEPTLIQISTITGPIATTKQTLAPRIAITPQQKITQSQQQDWHSFRPATKHYMHTWRKPWPGSSKMCKRTRSSWNEFQDRPEQSEPSRLWKQPSPHLPKTTRNQSTKFQNTPLATNVGDAHQVFTWFQSQIYLNMMSKINTTRTRSLGTKSRKSYNKTRTCQTKSPKNTEHHQRNSRKTPLWLWSPGPCPPICSSNTATPEKQTLERKISPCGENHFSKRRSERESYCEYNSINKSHRSKSRDENSKSESKSESKGIKVRHENKLVTLSTDSKAKVTAKADEVKAIRKTQAEFRMELGKQLDKMARTDLQATFHLHFATAFTISIIMFIYITLTIFILIFNPFLLDHFDHHFQTFTPGNLRVCEMHYSSQKTASSQAKTTVTPFATPDSTRSFRVPETRPNILYRNQYRDTLVPKHLRSLGRLRNPENDPYNDSFILIYLALSR
jgi:hypothetical protein